jgi:hypothetical protein
MSQEHVDGETPDVLSACGRSTSVMRG